MAEGMGVPFMLVVVQLLFGVNYIASKVIVTAFPPLVWASFRALLGGAFLVVMALAMKRPPPTDGRRFFLPLVRYAFLGIALNQGCFLVGLRHTTPTNSAVLSTLIPVFTILIGTIRGEEELTLRRFAGFGSALLGALVLMKIEHLAVSTKTLFGDLLTVVNAASYALFLSIAGKFLREHERVWTSAWLFLYGGLGLGVAALPDLVTFHMPALTLVVIVCMCFAILGGTVLAYGLSLWSLARTRASSVALYIYLQPVIASLAGWAWLGQRPSARTVIATLAILAGLLLATPPAERATG